MWNVQRGDREGIAPLALGGPRRLWPAGSLQAPLPRCSGGKVGLERGSGGCGNRKHGLWVRLSRSPAAVSSEYRPRRDTLAFASWVFNGPDALICFISSEAPQG